MAIIPWKSVNKRGLVDLPCRADEDSASGAREAFNLQQTAIGELSLIYCVVVSTSFGCADKKVVG